MLLNGFFRALKSFNSLIEKKIRDIYRSSDFYETKISKTFNVVFQYKPSPYLLSSLINYQNKKYKIDDLDFNNIWESKSQSKEFKKLNNFFWFFSLDLKSSKKSVQEVILNWMNKNNKF